MNFPKLILSRAQSTQKYIKKKKKEKKEKKKKCCLCQQNGSQSNALLKIMMMQNKSVFVRDTIAKTSDS